MFNKKTIKNNFLSLAYFERESDLKRKWAKNYKPITPIQRTWTRYMLELWAEQYGGGVDSELDCRGSTILGNLIISSEWGKESGSKIITVINRLYRQGLRGDELFLTAKEIIMPKQSIGNLIDKAIREDDADFVESVLSAEFSDENPIKLVAIEYFCCRKSQRDIASELESVIGIESARRKIRWCLNLFEGVVYHMMQARSQHDKSYFGENVEIILETAPKRCIV